MEADKINGESSNLIQAQAHVWTHALKFMDSLSLKCAVQLGIPDIIHSHGQPMTLSSLVAALHLQPSKSNHIRRLMRVLIHSGFFAETSADEHKTEVGYIVTPASRLLLQTEPLAATPLLLLILDHVLMNPWEFLSSWFRSDHGNAFEMANGSALWDYITGESRFRNVFHQAMLCDSKLVADVVVRECGRVFEGLNSVVDVGGGTGTMARAIAGAFPHISCTVYDLPEVVENLEGSKNLRFVGGDMYKEVPKANAVLLKWILHDWDDEESIKILKNCREAIPRKEEGGKVIVIDMVIGKQQQSGGDEESSGTDIQLWFDMLMMVNTHGKERDLKEWESVFYAAGFSGFKIIHEIGARSVIEVYP